VQGFAALADEVARWREASPAPPARLGERIQHSLRAAEAGVEPPPMQREWTAPDPSRETVVSLSARRPAAARSARLHPVAPWLAAAPGIVPAAGLLLRSDLFWHPPTRNGPLLVEQAVHDAEVAEAAHARAIAELERAAAPVLARAGDPALPPREAALLLS